MENFVSFGSAVKITPEFFTTSSSFSLLLLHLFLPPMLESSGIGPRVDTNAEDLRAKIATFIGKCYISSCLYVTLSLKWLKVGNNITIYNGVCIKFLYVVSEFHPSLVRISCITI